MAMEASEIGGLAGRLIASSEIVMLCGERGPTSLTLVMTDGGTLRVTVSQVSTDQPATLQLTFLG